MKRAMGIFAGIVCLLMFSLTLAAFSQEVYKFELMWGSQGIGDGQFSTPSDVAVDFFGNVYVADTGNNRIQKFDSDGNFITKWGTVGPGDGQFSGTLLGVAVDSSRNVYISDSSYYSRIQKFDSNGNFIAKWDFSVIDDGDDYFYSSGSVATSSIGNVYAVVFKMRKSFAETMPTEPLIYKFDLNGNFITRWGGAGAADGQFHSPEGIAVDPLGNVYVADAGNYSIQKYDSAGNFIIQWDAPDKYRGGCMVPSGVATDLFGNLYVSNVIGCLGIIDFPTVPNIMKFDSNGTFITEWISGSPLRECPSNHPQGVAVDPFRNVYVADPCDHRIQKFSPIISSSQYTLSITVNPPGSGSVSKDPNKSTYVYGDQVTLTANPNSGYTFSSWSGVDSSNGTTASVTMNGNRTVTANFTAPVRQPNVTPYQPTGWSDKIIVSNVKGTNIDSVPLYNKDPFYVDWAVINNGTSPASGYSVALYIDGVLINTWSNCPLLKPNSNYPKKDYLIDSLGVGTHTLKISVGNNEYTKTINIFDISTAIDLTTPSDNTSFGACSLYSPPTFSWAIGDTFKSYKIQFSSVQDFSVISVTVRTSSNSTVINSNTWKRVLSIPGGTVYWSVVGTRMNRSIATSKVRSIVVEPAQTVGNLSILETNKSSLPTVSWGNNCNKKFKAWFGSDSDFTKRSILTFNVTNPTDNGGLFTKLLTSGQWVAIRKLVGNVSGSTIYWYVESWDGLGRYSKTAVMNFVPTD